MENHVNSGLPNGWELVTVVRSDGTTMQIRRRSENHCLCAALVPPNHAPYAPFVNQVPSFIPPYHPPYATFFNPRPSYHSFMGDLPFSRAFSYGNYGGSSHTMFPNYPGTPQRIGNRQEVITRQTMEILVPRSSIPAIVGDEYRRLIDIGEFSGASITILRSPPGSTETRIILSGTPGQVYAAKYHIQGSVVLEDDPLDLHL